MSRILFIFLFLFFGKVSAINPDDLLGTWMSTDNSVKVEVYKVNNQFKAKVLWFNHLLSESKTPMHLSLDTNNPNPALRNRKILGMEILDGLRYDAQKNEWVNGKIYDASSGRYWSSCAKLLQNGILKVRGFWKVEWIGKSISFKKVA